MTYVVAGVTGNTGKVVAETLLAQREPVRVIVRDAAKGEPWKARGAEVAVADLNDASALARAFEGAKGAYVLIPPDFRTTDFRAHQDRVTAALAGAIAKSGLPHAVLLSSFGAQHASGNGPVAGVHRAEAAFAKIAGTRFSLLRAGYFIENLAGSLGMLDQGVLQSFVPADFPIPMIATKDIGRVAAGLLVENGGGIVELGGPPRTMNDAARALTALTGRTITVQVAPLDAIVPALTSAGLTAELAGMFRELTEGMLSGHVTFEGKHRRLEGTTTLEEVLRPFVQR